MHPYLQSNNFITIENNEEIFEIIKLENGQRKEIFKNVLNFKSKIELKCRIEYKKLNFYFKDSHIQDWTKIEIDFDTTKYSDEYSQYGEFTSTFCGIFVIDCNKREKKAIFDYFQYNDF